MQVLLYFCISYPISERADSTLYLGFMQYTTMFKLKTSIFHVCLERSAVLKVDKLTMLINYSLLYKILYFGNLLNLNYGTYFLN